MFEKEAEEATLDLYGSADDVYGKEDYKQGFKDGAEFGYNKGKKELEKENAELKEQIEEMKCCGNCKHFDFNEPNYCYKGVYREHQYICDKWELRR